MEASTVALLTPLPHPLGLSTDSPRLRRLFNNLLQQHVVRKLGAVWHFDRVILVLTHALRHMHSPVWATQTTCMDGFLDGPPHATYQGQPFVEDYTDCCDVGAATTCSTAVRVRLDRPRSLFLIFV